MLVITEKALAESKAILRSHYPKIRFRTKINDRGHQGIDFTLIISSVDDHGYACAVGSELVEHLKSKYSEKYCNQRFWFDVVIKSMTSKENGHAK